MVSYWTSSAGRETEDHSVERERHRRRVAGGFEPGRRGPALGPQRLPATFARFAGILTNSTKSNKMHNMYVYARSIAIAIQAAAVQAIIDGELCGVRRQCW